MAAEPNKNNWNVDIFVKICLQAEMRYAAHVLYAWCCRRCWSADGRECALSLSFTFFARVPLKKFMAYKVQTKLCWWQMNA